MALWAYNRCQRRGVGAGVRRLPGGGEMKMELNGA